MRRRCLRFSAASYLALSIACVMGNHPVTQAQELWTSDVSMVLLRESDGASIPLEKEGLELTTQIVVVKPNDRLENLLRTNGIYADAEAFGAVYALNPSLDPTALHPGLELFLPYVRGEKHLQEALNDRYLVALTLDVGLKRRLLAQAEDLRGLADDFAALEPHRFRHRDVHAELLMVVRRSLDFMGALSIIIRERSRPFSSEMLWQTSSEAQLLASILSDILTTGRVVTRHDEETIGLIAENMQLRSTNLKGIRGPGEPPQRFPQVSVSVKTLKTQDRGEVHGLRVYYAPRALYGRDGSQQPFLTVSSPTTKWLPIANYRLWVGKPGDPKPLSEVLDIEVRKPPKGDSMLVELVVYDER
jgi:hypothetical protein